MIETIELHNFKSHRDTKIHLDDSRLHALVGQNSSGKTSVLQALHTLSRLANSSHKNIFIHPISPHCLASVGQNHFSVQATGVWKFRDELEAWQGWYEFIKTSDDGWFEPYVKWNTDYNNKLESEGSALLFENPDPSLEPLKDSVYLKLMATNLAKPAYSEAVIPKIQYNGSDLAPTLDYVRNEAPDYFQNIQDWMKRIVPSVMRVRIGRAQITLNRQRIIEVNKKSIPFEETQEVLGQEVVFDMTTGERIPAHAISEGTMLALGLLTVLANPNPPNLVLLDDIEQGLHPKAQRELVAVFKEIIQENPNLQIIFSTHSPYIVDELKPSQVHVLSNDRQGFAHCKRLDEHPDAEWAIQTLTTGEFWSAEGEDWVTAGEQDA